MFSYLEGGRAVGPGVRGGGGKAGKGKEKRMKESYKFV